MAEGRNILIAIDGSEHSERAFQWYLSNVRESSDKLILFHCHELHSSHGSKELKGEEWQGVLSEHEEKLKALEKKYKDKCEQAGVDARIVIHGGNPGHEICNTSKSENVSCIIMAPRGLGMIRRTLLGSTSDYVLHHSHVPVIIVPKEK